MVGADVEETLAYDEFGVPLVGTGKALNQPFGFTGYQTDDVSGLYYAQARYYDAGVGRFGARDIVKGTTTAPFTLNEYMYCWSRPLTLVDLDGAWPEFIESIGSSVAGFWNTYIYGEDVTTTIVPAETIDTMVGAYAKTSVTQTTHTGGSIIVKKTTVGATQLMSTGLSINIPGVASLGASLGKDGLALNAYVGFRGVSEINAKVTVGGSDIVGADLNAKLGMNNGNMYGLGLGLGLNPSSSLKGYVFSEHKDENGFKTYYEYGLHMKMGIVYATILTLAYISAVISSGGLAGAGAPGYASIMALILAGSGVVYDEVSLESFSASCDIE